jgi:hypothetical protein
MNSGAWGISSPCLWANAIDRIPNIDFKLRHRWPIHD